MAGGADILFPKEDGLRPIVDFPEYESTSRGLWPGLSADFGLPKVPRKKKSKSFSETKFSILHKMKGLGGIAINPNHVECYYLTKNEINTFSFPHILAH